MCFRTLAFAFVFVLALCFDCVVADIVVVPVVPVVVPVVPVVVPVPKLQAPSVSPCPMCAGSAFLLISIVTPGFFFDPVL